MQRLSQQLVHRRLVYVQDIEVLYTALHGLRTSGPIGHTDGLEWPKMAH